MRTLSVVCLLVFAANLVGDSHLAVADSRGDELAQWLDARGSELWGKPPARCDDLTFARRIYLDLLGLPPTPDEVARCQTDSSANAYERMVDIRPNKKYFRRG